MKKFWKQLKPTLSPSAKKLGRSFWILSVLIILAFGTWLALIFPYLPFQFGLVSPAAESLRVFYFNQSRFADPVKKCWYDSGDYIIFAQRDAEALAYLSLAYHAAKAESVRADLKAVIESQAVCLEGMLQAGWKQFGDQDSHGINLPPLLHALFFPRRNYHLRPTEGGDVALWLALVRQEIGKPNADTKSFLNGPTKSEGCCEEGPLVTASSTVLALRTLVLGEKGSFQPTWGLSWENLALINPGQTELIAGMLRELEKKWDQNGRPFHYLGGNYDIAGTVALIRLYELKTGDRAFDSLARSLYDYLHGQNVYGVDFTSNRRLYHPCDFFGWCGLKDTLVNGVDESGAFNLARRDAWREQEVQLVGQARYVLAKVLMEGW